MTRRLFFLLIFGLSGAAVLISLGVWQIQRLAWKQGVLAQIEERINESPYPVPIDPTPEQHRYLAVNAVGHIEPNEVHVLVSVKRVGAGYRIIAPFTLEDGRRVLLDRGFVPTKAKGLSRETGDAVVQGNLLWPDEIDGYTPAPDLEGNIWFARDVDALGKALDALPILIVAENQTDPNITPLPVTTSGIPNDHLNYAITWFSLALIWIAMTSYFLWRSRVDAKGDVT